MSRPNKASTLRRCTNKDMRAVLAKAMKLAPWKLTKSGIIFYGPGGMAGTHFTTSDKRAVKNIKSDLLRVGIFEKGKQ